MNSSELSNSIKDAQRYRWLKEQIGLTLTTERTSIWVREDGTIFVPSHRLSSNGVQYGVYPTLNETIDNARLTLEKLHTYSQEE